MDWFINNSRSFDDYFDYKENSNHSIEDLGDEIFVCVSGVNEGIDKLIKPPKDYKGPTEEGETLDGEIKPLGYSKARNLLVSNPYGILPSEIPVSLRKPENYEKKLDWIINETEKRVGKTKENSDA